MKKYSTKRTRRFDSFAIDFEGWFPLGFKRAARLPRRGKR